MCAAASTTIRSNWLLVTETLVPLKPGKEDESSFKILVDTTRYSLNQSQLIQLGHQMEEVVKKIVSLSSEWKHVFIGNSTGKKEKDHVLVHQLSGRVVILEQKNNLNLDTEKCKSTATKLPRLIEEISSSPVIRDILSRPPVSIEAFILGSRYVQSSHIPTNIVKKYQGVRILGMDDLCEFIGIEKMFGTEAEYRVFINDVLLPRIIRH